MNKEVQPSPPLPHEKPKLVKIVRTIRVLQDALTDARTKPNFGEIKRSVRLLIDEQVKKLSHIAPDLVEGVRYLIFEKYARLELERHQADFQSGFITEQQFADYQRLFEDTLRNKARSIPKSDIDRLRIMQLTIAERKKIRDKQNYEKNRDKRIADSKKYHKLNRENDNKNRQRKRANSEYLVKEIIRDELRREQKRKEVQDTQPTQVFPDTDKK